MPLNRQHFLALGAQATGSQTEAGGGQGAGTTTAQVGAGAQAHFFLWHASALPTRTRDPTNPLRIRVMRCRFIDASPWVGLPGSEDTYPSARSAQVVNHGHARKVG